MPPFFLSLIKVVICIEEGKMLPLMRDFANLDVVSELHFKFVCSARSPQQPNGIVMVEDYRFTSSDHLRRLPESVKR